MKKIFLIVIIIIALIISLIIIANMFSDKEITIQIEELAMELKNAPIFEDKLSEIDRDTIIKKYNFNNEKIEEIVSYVGTGATAEEILVMKVFNKNDINEMRVTIENKIEERKKDFEDYLPKEVSKLENYHIETRNNYIILCISNNAKEAKEIIDKYIMTNL